MLLASITVVFGLALLVLSADRFVLGASGIARHFGIPPLVIGMVIVGFGTSAPELSVSALAAWQGNPGIALGNAYGSNIANLALILGITALISPIAVQSGILRKELPVLLGVSLLALTQAWDGSITRMEAGILLLAFLLLFGWTIFTGLRTRNDALGTETEEELKAHPLPIQKAWLFALGGLVGLLISSRMLVWGAVALAKGFGADDILIGLTVVAVGTSLPELASSIAAARKGEHDVALGNVIGSNLFNTLAVVGLAAAIAPPEFNAESMRRDMAVMIALTAAVLVMGISVLGRPGRVNRWEGGLLLASYLGYTAWLIAEAAAPG